MIYKVKGSERDHLQKLPTNDLAVRVVIANFMLDVGRRSGASLRNLNEIQRQKAVLMDVLKDRELQRPKPSGPKDVVIQLKPLELKVRRT
jgi:hypothetical protein